jgi:hypothetical protein
MSLHILPVCAFFGNDSLLIPAEIQRFVEYKKSNVKSRMGKVIDTLINEEKGLKIGDTNLEFVGQTASHNNNTVNDIQVQLLHEVRQKLFGRSIAARGSAMFVHDEIWFFPNQLRFS